MSTTTLTTTGTVDLSIDADADTITIGQSGATDDVVNIAGNISLTDDQWSVTAAGVGGFITGTTIGSMTFTTNNILDSGALTIKTTTTGALTLDSGTTGSVLIGTGVAAKTITIGNATDDTLSINSSGLNVTSGGALTGVASIDTIATSATALTFAGAGTIASTGANALALNGGATGAVNITGNAASSFNYGSNALTITSGTGASTFNTTATGINATQIGATTAASGAFTTLTSTGVTGLGNNSATVAIDGTNFDLSTAGVITLAGAQTKDITTTAAATSTALVIAPGDSTVASGTGSNLTLRGSNQTGTASVGGNLVLQGGTGALTNGLVQIGTANTSAITLGVASIVTTAAGGLTVTTGQNLIVNGDSFTDLTGNAGLAVSGSSLIIDATTTGTTATASSNSGLEIGSDGLRLLGGCTGSLIVLKWNTGTSVWECAADNDSGGATAWNNIGDATLNGAIAFGSTVQTLDWATMDANASFFTFNFTNAGTAAGTDSGVVINNASNTASSTDAITENLLLIQQLDTATGNSVVVNNGILVDSAAAAGMVDGIEITNSGGNITGSGLNIADTAGGTFATGITMSGTFTNLIDAPNFDVDNAGNIDVAGTITAGSGNVAVTDAAGKVQHDSVVDCADTQILKWSTVGGWACAADNGATEVLAETTLGSAASSINLTVAAREFLNCYLSTKGNTATAVTWVRFNNDSGANYDYQLNYNIATTFTESQGLAQAQIVTDITDTEAQHLMIQVSNFADSFKNVWLRSNRADATTGPDNQFGSGTWRNSSAQITTVSFLTSTSTFLAGSHAWCEGRNVADYAENYYSKDLNIKAGDVVTHDPSLPAGIQKASKPYDPKLIGSISTKPGIVLDDGIGFGQGWQYPVALSGRIPVKVSTINGPIRSGDLLTSSSIPGVAMRATKAGAVIGQAMDAFDGEGIGKVMTFVKTVYYNGSSSFDLLSSDGGILNADENTNMSARILDYVVNEKPKYVDDTALSEVVTDRMVAGLEIITPKITTDNLTLNTIKPVEVDVVMELGADGRFVIKNPDGEEVIAFDSLGNAKFTGTVTANKLKANQIEGLEILTDKISSLQSLVDSQQLSGDPDLTGPTHGGSGDQSVLSAATNADAEASGIINLSNLNIQTVTVTLDLSVGGMLYARGGLTVDGLAQFNGESIFDKLVTFKTDINLEGRATFNNDAGGFAVIHSGQSSVDVIFDKPYDKPPVISLGIKNGRFAQYAYTEIKEDPTDPNNLKIKGFKIILSAPANEDIEFAWTALSIKDAKTAQAPTGP